MSTENRQNNNKMSSRPIPGLMLAMGIPMILSMVVQAFYNIVDSYFVSGIRDAGMPNLREAAVNALTLAFPVQMLMIAVGVGMGIGVNSLLSRSLGENNRKRASETAGNAVFLGICTYLAFLVFGIFGVRPFLASQTSDPLTLELGNTYLGICTTVSFGAIGFMIYEKLLQGTGKTMLSTIAQAAGAVTNIIFDPVLIYGYLGFPRMGIEGAAVATVAGQIVSLALGMVFHYGFNQEVDRNPSYMKPDKKVIGAIFKVGAPAVVMQALMPVMAYGINMIFGMVSDAVVTAFGIYYKIQQFVLFAAFGLNNAIIPIVAFNYGMGDTKRVRSGIRYGLLYTLVIMLLGMAGLQIFAVQVCGIFALSAQTQLLCIRAIRIVTLGFLFAGVNIAFQGVFQALGCGISSLAVSLIRLIIVVLPLAYLLALLPDAQSVVWYAFPIAEACAFVAALFMMRAVSSRRLKCLGGNSSDRCAHLLRTP